MPNAVERIIGEMISGTSIASYLTYFTVMTTTFASAIKSKVNKSLLKSSTIKKTTTASLPPEVTRKFDTIDEDEVRKMDIGSYILNFVKTMKDIIPVENQTLLLNNLNTLNNPKRDIYLYNFLVTLFGRSRIVGSYNPKDNSIRYTKAKENVLYHELMHASSAYYDKQTGIYYCGFAQSDSKNPIGNSLNEGYTEWLTATSFFPGESYKSSSGYIYSLRNARTIEYIVGKDNMRNYYFNANLSGLIDHLGTYSSLEETYNFIYKTDFIQNYLGYSNLTNRSLNLLTVIAKETNEYLLKTFIRKTLAEDPNKIVLPRDVKEKAQKCYELLPETFTYKGREYKILDDDLIEKTYQDVKTEMIEKSLKGRKK